MILIVLVLFGCEQKIEQIQFEESQPEGGKVYNQFTKKLRGKYVSCYNSNKWLIIDAKVIRKEFRLLTKLSKKELDSLSTDDVKMKENNLTMSVEWNRKKDSVIIDYIYKDTLFKISNNQYLKKMGKNYFLNSKTKNDRWHVKRLLCNKDTLWIGEIYPSDSLLAFNFISKYTKIETDSTKKVEYMIKSDRKELKEMIKSNAFKSNECFCKLK